MKCQIFNCGSKTKWPIKRDKAETKSYMNCKYLKETGNRRRNMRGRKENIWYTQEQGWVGGLAFCSRPLPMQNQTEILTTITSKYVHFFCWSCTDKLCIYCLWKYIYGVGFDGFLWNRRRMIPPYGLIGSSARIVKAATVPCKLSIPSLPSCIHVKLYPICWRTISSKILILLHFVYWNLSKLWIFWERIFWTLWEISKGANAT